MSHTDEKNRDIECLVVVYRGAETAHGGDTCYYEAGIESVASSREEQSSEACLSAARNESWLCERLRACLWGALRCDSLGAQAVSVGSLCSVLEGRPRAVTTTTDEYWRGRHVGAAAGLRRLIIHALSRRRRRRGCRRK